MRREQRRQEILDHAREAFAEKGYHGAGVADIIARAQVARGTFYLYFESKRAVFEELLDGMVALIHGRIRRVETTGSRSDIVRQIRANLEHTIGVLVSNRALTRILLHEAVGLDDGFDAKLCGFYRDVHTLIAESLVTGQAMGLVRPLDPALTARFLLGSLKELMFDLTLAGDTMKEGAAVVDELLVFILRAIAEPSVLDAVTDSAGAS